MLMYKSVSCKLFQLWPDLGSVKTSSGWTTEQSFFVILQTSKMFNKNKVLVISSCKFEGDVTPFNVTGTLAII